MTEKPKITYVRGRGMAEVTRLIFAVKDVETTEEHVITKPEFEKLKSDGKLLFQQLPLLEIDGQCLIDSNAQAMYLGMKYEMLGTSDQEKGMVQMLFHGAKAFYSISGPFWHFKPEEDREAFVKNAISKAKSRYLPAFEKILTENGTGFLVGGSVTIADCALFNVLPSFQEMPEYGDLLNEWPKCKAFIEEFSSIPGVKKYLASPRRFPPPDEAYAAEVFAALY